jgi:hypothetical protein
MALLTCMESLRLLQVPSRGFPMLLTPLKVAIPRVRVTCYKIGLGLRYRDDHPLRTPRILLNAMDGMTNPVAAPESFNFSASTMSFFLCLVNRKKNHVQTADQTEDRSALLKPELPFSSVTCIGLKVLQ